MTEETVLLFKSDIVANIDLSSANKQISAFKKKLADVASSADHFSNSIVATFENIDVTVRGATRMLEQLGDKLFDTQRQFDEFYEAIDVYERRQQSGIAATANEYAELQQRLTALSNNYDNQQTRLEELGRENRRLKEGLVSTGEEGGTAIRKLTDYIETAGETTRKTSSEFGNLADSIRRMMESQRIDITGAIGRKPTAGYGTFETGISFAREHLAGIISDLKDANLTVEQQYEAIKESVSKNLELISARTGRTTDAIYKAWMDLAQKLIFGSLIPEMVNAIAQQISRLRSIIMRGAQDVANAGKRIADGLVAGIAKIKTMDVSAVGKDVANKLKSGMSTLATDMEQIGRNAATSLVDGITDGIKAAPGAAANAVKAISTSMANETRLQFGNLGDAMTKNLWDAIKKRGPAEAEWRKYQRALALGMEDTAQIYRDNLTKMGSHLETTEQKTTYLMREMENSVTFSMKNMGAAIMNAASGMQSFGSSMHGLRTAFGQVTRSTLSMFGVTQSMGKVYSGLGRGIRYATQDLTGFQKEGEIVDKTNRRLAESLSKFTFTMKEQGQIFVKMHEGTRKNINAQIAAIEQYQDIYSKAALYEETHVQRLIKLEERLGNVRRTIQFTPSDQPTSQLKQEELMLEREINKIYAIQQKLALGVSGAVRNLKEVGIAEAVFKDVGLSIEQVDEGLKEVGRDGKMLGQTLSASMTGADDTMKQLQGRFVDMYQNFPKQLSMINKAFQDLEVEASNYLTTLRNGGKVSVEQLQNVLHNMEHVVTMFREMRKTTTVSPEIDKYFNNIERSMRTEIENFAILAQRAMITEKMKERLRNTTKQVASAIGDVGRAAATHLPFLHKRTKEAADSMEKFRGVSSRVGMATTGISMALGNLSPEFQSLSMSAGYMGRDFAEVMRGMSEVAGVKGASIIKTLNLVKLASVGIIGVFGTLMVSTAKLAAEVTTLNMTMEVVATNTQNDIEVAKKWVKVIEDLGITTKEATTTVTNWMRSFLPSEFEDPISKATYTLEDFVSAAQSVAVTVGVPGSEAVARFIDVMNTGQSTLLNEIGIMKNVSQMQEEYAAAIGKTTKTLTPYEQKLGIAVGLLRETANLQGVYTKAMTTASKQMTSMTRYLEQLRLVWGKQFEPILTLIIFRFNQLLQLLIDIPEKTKSTVAMFVTVGTAISGVALALSTILPLVAKVMVPLRMIMSVLSGPLGIVLAILIPIGIQLKNMFMSIEVGTTGVQGLVDRFNILIGSLDKILGKFGGIKEAVQVGISWVQKFAAMVKYHFGVISEQIRNAIGGATERIRTFFEEHPEIAAFLAKLKTVFKDLLNSIFRAVNAILSGIEALLSGDWERFFTKLKVAAKYIIAWFLEFFTNVVQAAWVWGKNIITSFAKGIIDQAKTIIPRVLQYIGNLIGAFLEGHSPAKMGPLSNIDIWGEGIMSGFEKGLLNKKITFDEDMFEGIGSLGAKAKLWGSNIIEVFTAGITGKAAAAIGPAMGQVGDLLARFLEGHSPPEAGRLQELMDWGRNAFEVFLKGFEEADFSFLDNALELIQRRLQLLVGESEDSANKIAKAMVQVREQLAGAIFAAKTTGGPLDLSGIQQTILDTFNVFTKDVAAVLEVVFKAMRAQSEYEALEKAVEKARQARQSAMDAASREVSAAQARVEAVQRSANKYGLNILSWEQINAQAQLDLAETRRSQLEQENERIGSLEEAELTLAKERYEAAQAQADYMTTMLEQRMKGEEMLAEAEKEAGEKASDLADELADKTKDLEDGIGKLLEQFGKLSMPTVPTEEKIRKVPSLIRPAEADLSLSQMFKDAFAKLADPQALAASIGDGIGKFWDGLTQGVKDIWKKFLVTPVGQFLEKIGISGIIETFVREIGEIADKFSNIGDSIKHIKELWASFTADGTTGAGILKVALDGIYGLVRLITGGIEGAIVIISGLIQGTSELITGIWGVLSGEDAGKAFEGLNEVFKDTMSELAGIVGDVLEDLGIKEEVDEVIQWLKDFMKGAYDWFGGLSKGFGEALAKFDQKVAGWKAKLIGLPDEIAGWFNSLPKKIGEALSNLWNTIVQWFTKIYDDLVGNSIVVDLINDIVGLFAALPAKLLEFAGTFLNSAITLASNLYDGIKTKIDEIAANIGAWVGGIAANLLTAGTALWNSAVAIGQQIFNGIKLKVDEIKTNIVAWFTAIGTTMATAAVTIYQKAISLATSIVNAFRDVLFGEGGLQSKLVGWFTTIVTWLTGVGEKASNIVTKFYDAGKAFGQKMVDAIGEAVRAATTAIGGFVKGLWNNGLRPAFQGVLNKIADAINGVVNALNSAWRALGSPKWIPGFPIPGISVPQLPSLQVGGIVMEDIVAQLHAGEIVLPLDRLTSVLSGLNLTPAPAFSPVMNFYAGTSPQQIVPGVQNAYNWYVEELRRSD